MWVKSFVTCLTDNCTQWIFLWPHCVARNVKVINFRPCRETFLPFQPRGYIIKRSYKQFTSVLRLNTVALAVWLTAPLKLLGHAVMLGGSLAFNALSFPAIMTCLWSFWTMRPRESQKCRKTNGESGSVWPQIQTPKKETRTVIQWEASGSLHHCGPISQTECDRRLGLELLEYNLLLTVSNCNKWCYTVEYSGSTVSLLQKIHHVHIYKTFLLLFMGKHIKPSALFVPDFIIVCDQDHSLSDVCNERKLVWEWSNTHYVFPKKRRDLIVPHDNRKELSSAVN